MNKTLSHTQAFRLREHLLILDLKYEVLKTVCRLKTVLRVRTDEKLRHLKLILTVQQRDNFHTKIAPMYAEFLLWVF